MLCGGLPTEEGYRPAFGCELADEAMRVCGHSGFKYSNAGTLTSLHLWTSEQSNAVRRAIEAAGEQPIRSATATTRSWFSARLLPIARWPSSTNRCSALH